MEVWSSGPRLSPSTDQISGGSGFSSLRQIPRTVPFLICRCLGIDVFRMFAGFSHTS